MFDQDKLKKLQFIPKFRGNYYVGRSRSRFNTKYYGRFSAILSALLNKKDGILYLL